MFPATGFSLSVSTFALYVYFSSEHDYSRNFIRFRLQKNTVQSLSFIEKGCLPSIPLIKVDKSDKTCHNWRPTWGPYAE